MSKKELSIAILKKYNPDTEYAKRVLQKIIHDNRMFAERAFYCFQIYIMMHKKATADLGQIPKMCSGFFPMASFSSVLPAS